MDFCIFEWILDDFELISLYFSVFFRHFLEISKNTFKNESSQRDTFYKIVLFISQRIILHPKEFSW